MIVEPIGVTANGEVGSPLSLDQSTPPLNQSATPFNPYLENDSWTPSPDILPNVTGNVSLPQISSVQDGSNSLYILIFVTPWEQRGSILEFDTGMYSPSSASSIMEGGGCTASCSQHVPVDWNAPIPIAIYGSSHVSGDALGIASGSQQIYVGSNVTQIFVAATSNNSTNLFVSQSMGAPDSWYTLNGETPISGGNPRIAVSPGACSVAVVTQTSSSTIVTTFQKVCEIAGYMAPPSSPEQHHEEDARQGVLSDVTGQGSGAPGVYGVVPYSAPVGYSELAVNGVGFSGVQSVLFGTVAATYVVKSTQLIEATVPPGSGLTHVEVVTTGGTNPANCSSQFQYASSVLPTGTPQVSWVNPGSAQVGATVSIYGYNFAAGDTVSFGTVRAAAAALSSPNTLSVPVPLDSGTVNVTVTSPAGLTSPVTCGDLFHYIGPYLLSISPTSGWTSTVVGLVGINFTTGASVYFGSTPATSVTYLSSTQLQAVAPPGSGTVAVTVHESSYTSNGINFQYVVPAPVVSYVDSPAGPPGTNVTVWGQDFTSTAQVVFGSVPSPQTTVLSGGRISAIVPSVSGTVNVTVIQPSGASAPVCTDDFTNSPIAYPPLTFPFLNYLNATKAVAGSSVTLYGVQFLPGDRVFFGPVASPFVNYSVSNATELVSEVPLGVGNVSVEVAPAGGGFLSPVNCVDHLDLSPANPPLNKSVTKYTLTLPSLASYSPAYSGLLYLGATTSAGKLLVYELNPKSIVTTYTVSSFAQSLGSSILTSSGDTELTEPGGTAGQVALIGTGEGLMLLATTDQDGRTVIESVIWNWTGWSEPYFVTPSMGSASDPQLALTPWGDIYATWVDGSSGLDGVDEAEFTSEGTLLQGPNLVTSSSGSSSAPARVSELSLTVDPMGHPFAAWESTGLAVSRIEYTGLYATPSELVGLEKSAWSQLVPPNFEDFGGPGRSAFEAKVSNTLTYIQANLTKSNWCNAAKLAASADYTNVTWLAYPPLVYNLGFDANCKVSVGSRINTIITETYGPLTADVYLAVETEWLLEAVGVGSMPVPDWDGFDYGSTGNATWYQPDTAGSASDLLGDLLTVNPETTGPNTLRLSTYGTFPGRSNVSQVGCYYVGDVDQPSNYTLIVGIKDSHDSFTKAFPATNYLSSPTLTDLYADENGSWTVWANVTFQTTATYVDYCGGSFSDSSSGVATPSGWPTAANLVVHGTFTTGLDPYPAQLHLFANSTGTKSTTQDSLSWTNTVDADAQLNISGSSKGVEWTNVNFTPQDHAQGGVLNSVPSPMKSMSLELQTNNSPPTWTPVLDAPEVSQPSPIQTFTEACTVSGSSTVKVWTTGTGVSNLTTSSATLTWNSTKNATGWVDLAEVGGEIQNLSAMVLKDPNGTAFEYVVEATGLDSWAAYNLTYYVTAGLSCKTSAGVNMATVTVTTTLAGGSFQVPGVADVFEQDAPYDSVSQTGGGATIAWQIPTSFFQLSNPKFLGGSVNLSSTNSSATAFVIPLSSLTPFTNYSQFGTSLNNPYATTYAINVSGLSLNNEYTAAILLNFSTPANPHFQGSGSHTFWYERDSSGDGLTDWEKNYGWDVTTTGPTGAVSNLHVTANPELYATNGLVGDFVEKQYALNPNTVDTANSGMLDTWNLTFSLASWGGAIPDSWMFRVWYENSSYDPFATGTQYSPGHTLNNNNRPLTANATNLTPSSSSGIRSGDGSPWAAEVLWSSGQLTTFEGMAGVAAATQSGASPGWLRAVEGSWKGVPTLTVEGKLSWGANPLAASTPNDGLLDGARVNPLYDVGLEFHSVYANQTNLGTGTGYAVHMYEAYYNDQSQSRTVSNYSSQALAQNVTYPDVTNYVTTLPATQTTQTQSVSLEVIANESSGFKPIPISGSSTELNVSYDLVLGTPWIVNIVGSGSNGYSTLYGVFQEVPMGTKAPTWLWLPTTNSTVNGLPIGLQRYIGEQSFDLVVVNASAPITSNPIPLPWGGTSAGLTLSPGMNDFLIPREQFLFSAFGQAIFAGKNTSYNTSNGAPPLVGSWEQADLTGFSGKNLMIDLGAYWQNRVISSGPGNITGSTETGTPSTSNQQVQEMAAPSTTSANSGGLPSDPSLYSTIGLPSAVQSILTLNISSNTTLDLFLAALFDNTTGGPNAVNGTFESITYQVGFLGLNAAVVNAISNATQPNDGLYGAPASHFPPPPPPSGWGAFWNAVTSFVTNPVGAVLSLASTIWTAATAAFTYLNHLVHEAVAIGAEIVARTAAALVHIGELIEKALAELLSYLLSLVTALLKTITQPVVNAIKAYTDGVGNALWHAQNDTLANGSLAAGDARAVWSALSGSIYLIALGLCAALTIAVTIISVLDVGPSFLADLVISLIVGTLIGVAIGLFLNSISSAFTSLSETAVYAMEAFFNRTVGTQRPHSGLTLDSGGSNQGAWTTAALIITTGFEFQLAFPLDLYTLLKATQTKGTANLVMAVYSAIVSLACDIVGLVLFAAGFTGPATDALTILGLAIGAYSLLTGYWAIGEAKEAEPPDPDLVTLIEVDEVFQGINMAGALYSAGQELA